MSPLCVIFYSHIAVEHSPLSLDMHLTWSRQLLLLMDHIVLE